MGFRPHCATMLCYYGDRPFKILWGFLCGPFKAGAEGLRQVILFRKSESRFAAMRILSNEVA